VDTQEPNTLSHIDSSGRARMVDVGAKDVTSRGAIAEGVVRVSPELADAILGNAVAKGNVFEVARLAGIQAAKRTAELIPLCHPLGLDYVDIELSLDGQVIRLRAEARVTARTGVEMEALTAVMVAALTVIDMGKSIDKGMVVEGVRLVEKWGGRSGHYRAGARG
jgi:cyclic pyranopterin phosphate synthase